MNDKDHRTMFCLFLLSRLRGVRFSREPVILVKLFKVDILPFFLRPVWYILLQTLKRPCHQTRFASYAYNVGLINFLKIILEFFVTFKFLRQFTLNFYKFSFYWRTASVARAIYYFLFLIGPSHSLTNQNLCCQSLTN